VCPTLCFFLASVSATALTLQAAAAQTTAPSAPSAPSAPADAVALGTLRVQGATPDTITMSATETGTERDARHKDEVYDLDASTSFAGREEVERYKGVTTADVLKGMPNVLTGDARNGGALDPNIRGMQGPGRVPVIIDGTEQALVVWRGYNGAGNRSYIDPNLIAGVQVLKGPASLRGIRGSTGGAVAINTLDASDILTPGQRFGVEVKLEGGNNATEPRLPVLLTGQDYRKVPNFLCPGSPPDPTYPYCDGSLRVALRKRDDNHVLSFGDHAARLALAARAGDFDLFGAYAYRERGNFFSGTTHPGYYQQREGRLEAATYIRKLGLNYEPGNEIPNTSSESESWLFKLGWHVAPDAALQIGFRDTKSKFGEIMPSRIIRSNGNFGNVQWPLSRVDAQAWNAEYKWQPETRWIDLRLNGWATHTISDTYSSGGFPNAASFEDPIIVNTAVANSVNDRFGFSGSNQLRVTPRLDLLLEGNWGHEKLGSHDVYSTAIANGWRAFPRAGRREEWRIDLKGEWRPTAFLKFNAGLNYSRYWAQDDFLPEYIRRRGEPVLTIIPDPRYFEYRTQHSGVDAYEAYLRSDPDWTERQIQRRLAQYRANPVPFYITHTAPWEPDANGKYSRRNNLCLSGRLADNPNYVTGSCHAAAGQRDVFTTEARRKRGDGWAPNLSATLTPTSTSRLYLRYAQAWRFPSMFESTLGFSASINPTQELEPEHLYSWEAAAIQDLRPLFNLTGDDQRADLKITWYSNITHDVIDRDNHLMFSNVARQLIGGLELQARYDNGRFFTDISAAHQTVNKVCDANEAILNDPTRGRMPDCVNYGFVNGYLLTQATPKNSVNWTLGGRFFDRRLELGGRGTWYSAYHNPQLDAFPAAGLCQGASCGTNIPYDWGETLTADAYLRFRFNDRYAAELVATNLTDRYYSDPLSRSMMPAPGRTLRLSLTGRF